MPLVFDQITPGQYGNHFQFPIDFPYMFHAHVYHRHYVAWADVQRWCEERFGLDDPEADWFSHHGKVWFRDMEHAMEFKLRWV